MFIDKKLVLIPGATFILSLIIEFTSTKVALFSTTLAKVIFWFSIATAGVIVSIELFARIHEFVNAKFRTPRKKLQEYREILEGEREEIEKLLDFEPEGKSLSKLNDHTCCIDESNFSKESLAPYVSGWYAHISHVYAVIRDYEHKHDMELFQKQKEQVQQEIEKLEKEKQQKQTSEEELTISKRDEFLKEYEERLYVDATYLSEEEKKWLEEAGYQRDHQWCIDSKKSVEFMIKPRHNESLSHAYLTGAIYKYIKEDGLDPDAELFVTKMPDIVFNYGGFQWAIEVETGTVHEKNKKQLKEKVKMLNEKFEDRWFFVVTNKNLLSKYRKFGDVVDRSNVIDEIDGIFYHEGYLEDEE